MKNILFSLSINKKKSYFKLEKNNFFLNKKIHIIISFKSHIKEINFLKKFI
jgi:hypothetical protein